MSLIIGAATALATHHRQAQKPHKSALCKTLLRISTIPYLCVKNPPHEDSGLQSRLDCVLVHYVGIMHGSVKLFYVHKNNNLSMIKQ